MTKRCAFYIALVLTTIAGSALAQSSITADSPNVTAKTGDSTTSVFHVLNSSNTELLRVQANGFVGIGAGVSPSVLLDLKGNAVDYAGQLRLQATDFDQITFFNSSNPTPSQANRLGYIYYDIGNLLMRIDNQAGNKSLILNGSGGGVGIGTTPAVLLDLKANNVPYGGQVRLQATDYDQITFYNSNSPSLNQASRLGDVYYDIAGTKLHIDNWAGDNTIILNGNGSGGGYIGIDAPSPTAMMQIGPMSPAYFRDMSTVNGSAGVELEMTANSEIHIANLQIGNLTVPVIQTTGTGNSPLYLNRDSDNDVIIGGGTTAHGHGLLVQSTGTSTFAGSVTVSHDVTVNGTVYANYQDVAEWVPASESMPAGTVVVISDDTTNTVTASTRPYDTGVAGVVSAAPGLLLGVAGDSKAKIATTGRVRVRVDASKYPIRKGDLLVTSDRPGMAMKSEPLDLGGTKIHRPGTLIGKALEPLASGEGEILVLLSLQ